MPDWRAFVRSRLSLRGLTPERESRIIRELATQLEDFYRDSLARGASEAEAEAHAAAQIGDWRQMAEDVLRADRAHAKPRVDRLADSIQDAFADLGINPRYVPVGSDPRPARGFLMIADALRDARYAIRQLIKTPGFTLVIVLTLALGIGATSAIFTVVNGVLLQPLPFPESDRLIRVHEVVPQYGRFSVAPATFLDWRQQNRVFERIAAYGTASGTIVEADGPERIQGAAVSWDMFDMLRVAPALGTSFTAAHDRPNNDNAILISHGLWQRRFGADPAIVGRSIGLNGVPVTILGVMPAGFYFPSRTTEFWRPLAIAGSDASRGAHFLGVIGRMKPGISVEQTAAEMKTISERLAHQFSDSANESAEIVTLHDQIVGSVRPALLTLLAAVGVVILIVCANVANLLLVRASVREKEVAIRAALGAGRRRLAFQMFVESLVLALTGGAIGVLLAYLAIPLIQTLGANSIPRVADIGIDLRVLLFAFGASVLTGILFGLAPAWHATRGGLGAVLKEGGRSSFTSSGRWIRNALLVAEVALSIVLLVGASLLLRSFEKLTNVDPGFKAANVLAFQVSLPPATYPQDATRIAFFDTLLERLETLPDVHAASMVHRLPLRGGYVLSFSVQGRARAKPGEEPSAHYRVISRGYFETLGIPLLRGRLFTGRDTEKPPFSAIVDEAFVTRHFPNENPIGRQLDIGNGVDGLYEIVGVVGNVVHEGLDESTEPTMYVPFKQSVFNTMWMLVRAKDDPARLSGAVRQAVREIDRALPAYSITPLSTVLSDSLAERRFSLLLLGFFALVAMFLAAVGLYGIVAYGVRQRTREIGVRLAIGARPGDVLRMVIGGGMKLTLIGVAVGLAGAVGLAQLVKSMLFDVTPSDPASYVATAVVLLVVAAVASYVPARRAMRVDPLVALQHE